MYKCEICDYEPVLFKRGVHMQKRQEGHIFEKNGPDSSKEPGFRKRNPIMFWQEPRHLPKQRI